MADAKSNCQVIDALSVIELVAKKAELQVDSLSTTSTMEVANAANNVTISNVAPAGVGTATISKWLQFTDSAGTVCYIPVWT